MTHLSQRLELAGTSWCWGEFGAVGTVAVDWGISFYNWFGKPFYGIN